MSHDHVVAFLEPVHTGPGLNDSPGDFVAQDRGSFLDPVPLHDVAAADAAGLHLDQQLTGPDLRDRQLLHAHVVVVVVHGDTHGGYTSN